MINTSRPKLIESLQTRLIDGTLPGEDAHLRMAHAVRRAVPQPDPSTTRNAAVLLTLFEEQPDDWHLVFIRRGATHAKDKHAGQIGFPGGKEETADPDLMYTALRETEEETSMDLSGVDVLGSLSPLYITVSKFMVHPYLAYSWKRPDLSPQEGEIEEVLELPLSSFRQSEARQETKIRLSQGIVLNHVPAFQVNGHTIWGATAMILNEFLDILPH